MSNGVTLDMINTDDFRREALHYNKYKCYNKAEAGSHDYMEYWREQSRRCKQGYSVGGIGITGEHYGYLNFGQIMVTVDEEHTRYPTSKEEHRKGKGRKKKAMFPSFWDGDRDYFWVKHIARWGIGGDEDSNEDLMKSFKELNLSPHIKIRPDCLRGGKHIAVAKARRKGYSYKNGWIVANQYNFEPHSTAVVGAYDKAYLYPEGTMAMANFYLSHLNKTTAWAKRQLSSSIDFKKSGYKKTINGVVQDAGYLSRIIAVSFGLNNPGAARGKDGGIVLLEEAGKFPNLQESVDATIDTLRDGIYYTGQMLIFGTGGGEDNNWEDFSTIFNTPDLYDIIALENTFEESSPDSFISFFVPDTQNMVGAMNSNGTTNWQKASEYWEKSFEQKKAISKNKKTIDNWLMEHPIKPSHSFKGHTGNIFPIAELKAQKAYVESNRLYKNVGVTGELYKDYKSGAIKFRPNNDLFALHTFPHKNNEDLTGAIVQYQAPQTNGDKEVPESLYYIAHDPYAFDQSTGVSIGSAYVIKAIQNRYVPNDVIVASYNGRPLTQDDYNDNLFKLAQYYNAKIGFENDRGDVIGYAKTNGYLNFLEKEFDLLYNKELASSSVNRNFGMHMNAKRKFQGMLYLRDWLLRKRGKDSNGKTVLNLHLIYDLALLEELIRFDPSPRKNFDRVSALIIAMYYERELDYQEISEMLENDSGQSANMLFQDKILKELFK